jgi:hypothetical protein
VTLLILAITVRVLTMDTAYTATEFIAKNVLLKMIGLSAVCVVLDTAKIVQTM